MSGGIIDLGLFAKENAGVVKYTLFTKILCEIYAENMGIYFRDVYIHCVKYGAVCLHCKMQNRGMEFISSFCGEQQKIAFFRIECNPLFAIMPYKYDFATAKQQLFDLRIAPEIAKKNMEQAERSGITYLEFMQRVFACGIAIFETWTLNFDVYLKKQENGEVVMKPIARPVAG